MIASVFIFNLVQHLGNCYPFISFYLKLEKSISRLPIVKRRIQTNSIIILKNMMPAQENNKLYKRKAFISYITSLKFLNFNGDLNQIGFYI